MVNDSSKQGQAAVAPPRWPRVPQEMLGAMWQRLPGADLVSVSRLPGASQVPEQVGAAGQGPGGWG